MFKETIVFFCFFTLVDSFNILPLFRHWNCVGFSDEIKDGKPYSFNVGDIPLVAWKTEDNSIISTLNGCKHLGSSLDGGWIENDCLVCPYHGIKHTNADSCGTIIDYDNKLWWSYDPIDKLPPIIPYEGYEYVTNYMKIDMDESLPFCAYNSMDLNHPEFIHNGIQGFGSSEVPSNFNTYIYPKGRVGITFNYVAKDNIKTFNYDANIGNITNNYNQFIYPSTTWSRVSANRNMIIVGVSMTPLKKNKTRWYVTVKHNYMNDVFGENLVKVMTMMILNQDKEQFKRQIKNEFLKDYMTLKKVLKHDDPIVHMHNMFSGYKYPSIEDFIDYIST